MCGRFTLSTPAAELATLFDGLDFSAVKPRYNISPTQQVVGLRSSESGHTEVAWWRWGLVPSWAKDLKIGARMINARSETAATKPSFRSAFRKRRCLVLADGFYEWKQEGDQKQPYFISRRDGQPCTIAGLWERWTDKQAQPSETYETCTLLTGEANAWMSRLHHRMPVFIPPERRPLWLDPEVEDVATLESWLEPTDEDALQAWPVDRRVNRPAHDSPDCIQPMQESDDSGMLF